MIDAWMIEAADVYHQYTHGSVVEPVLRGLELRVRRGEFVVIMGPSGCGKTTLLNILGLMMEPTSAATLRLAGREALGLSDAMRTRFRREMLGFVFQRFNLLPTIDVWHNVTMPLRIRGLSVDGEADRLLERVGLRECLRKKPGQLSVGQQQRVAIARAAIGRPGLLLADEPTGNLDSDNAETILELISGFHRDFGQTVVMITHNEHLSVKADRVLHMRDGRFID